MRRLFTIIGLALAVVGIAVPAMAGGFLSVDDDPPPPPGLTGVAGSAVTFDAPDGRSRYRRDGEIPGILAKRAGRSRLAVHFTLLPD